MSCMICKRWAWRLRSSRLWPGAVGASGVALATTGCGMASLAFSFRRFLRDHSSHFCRRASALASSSSSPGPPWIGAATRLFWDVW